ncbi:hypothetical protein ACJA25_00980 [Mycoplasmopsis hyopharyngis]|uniref:hypothetical protein n=1 Tax=Mycoplasmopsis hyopharyngis TaxID=29558 RepID=UPI0038733C69
MKNKYTKIFVKKIKRELLAKKRILAQDSFCFNRKNIIYLLTRMAIYLGFYLLTIIVPFISFIPIVPKIVTITYLPFVMVFAICHLGVFGALISGFGFGLSSWFVAIIYGFSIRYQYFDIAVMPRLLNAVVVYFLYLVLKFKSNPRLWKFILLSLIATILNVVLTVSATFFRHHFIGQIPTVLPFKIWFIRHIPSIILEPVFAVSICLLTYKFLVYTIQKQKNDAMLFY